MEEKPTYPANRDARAQLTEIESATSRRVHRLDRICGNKPAKLLDFKSLTLRSGSSRFGPVYLYLPATIPGILQFGAESASPLVFRQCSLEQGPFRIAQSVFQ